MEASRWESLVCVLLDLVVQHQHKSSAHASDHVRPGTLEEGFSSLILQNLPPAVDCALVHDVGCGRKGADGDVQCLKELVRKSAPNAEIVTCVFSPLTSFASGLHHHTTSDGVEGVRDQAGYGGHSLGDHPADNDVRVLGVWQHTWIWEVGKTRVRVKMERQTDQQGRARTGNVRAPLAVSKQPK